MNDFTNLIRDALTGGPDFKPEPGRQALEQTMRQLDRRARTMRIMTLIALVFMTGVTVAGLYQLVHADQDNVHLIAHGTFLAVVGVTGIGFSKLWLLLTSNHLMVMRELKGLAFLALREDEVE